MLLFMVLLAAFLYSNTLGGAFLYDDDPNIRDNTYIRVTELTFDGIRDAAFNSPCSARPLPNISFALNYYFDRYDVTGYHIVNIIIHIITGILLFFLIKATLEIPVSSGNDQQSLNPQVIAFSATLIWLVHPLCTQSVTYIVQRMTSMAAMFYILSFFFYVKGRVSEKGNIRWLFFFGSILSGICALGSKQIAATLPFFILFYEWYFFQDLSWDWVKRNLMIFAGIAVLFVGMVIIYMGINPFEIILSGYDARDFTLKQRVLTEFRVVIYYLSLFFFPHPSRLNLDYDYPLSYSLFDPVTTILSLLIIIGLFVSGILMARKERLLSFCVLWFLGNLVIESSVISLEIIYEHRTYLPSMLVSLMVVILAWRYIKPGWAKVLLLGVLVVVCSVWTYQRNAVWGDELALWRDVVAKSPDKARPHHNLGQALEKQDDDEGALREYVEAVRIMPCNWKTLNNIGYVLKKVGRYEDAKIYYLEAMRINSQNNHVANLNIAIIFAEQGMISEAIEHYNEALRIDNNCEEAHINLGNILAKWGENGEAINHFREALRINPYSFKAENNWGNALVIEGRVSGAIEHYEGALRINPEYAEAHYNLGMALAKEGRLDDAIGQFREVLRIDPDHVSARNNLDRVSVIRERISRAISESEEILKTDPENPVLCYRLGVLYQKRGNPDKAIGSYEKALSIDSSFIPALQGLALVYSAEGDYGKSLSYLHRILELRPDSPEVYYNIACMYARRNEVEESVSWLKRAIEKGFDDWELIRTDNDLEGIRGSKYYEKQMREHPEWNNNG